MLQNKQGFAIAVNRLLRSALCCTGNLIGKKSWGLPLILGTVAFPSLSLAQSVTVPMNFTDPNGIGAEIGYLTLEDSEYGLLITPNLVQLNPGFYGFHIHENPDCGPGEKDGEIKPGLAAGGHFDPENTGVHEGPYGQGHLGDLPPLLVNEDGTATIPVVAPRLTTADVINLSIMVHQMGDNFSDNPEPLGGGGARLACGVISG